MIRRNRSSLVSLVAVALLGFGLVGCSQVGETYQRGYIIDETTLAAVKPGMSKEQVIQILGTPSTSSTVGGDTWYYISEKSHRTLQFMPENVDNRRVLAASFSGNRLQRIAHYGLQDGKVFAFIQRGTPAAGTEQNFVGQLLRGLTRFDPINN